MNSTWFKDSHAPEKPANKFHTRLGIKKLREQVTTIKSYYDRVHSRSGESFKKEYTPPNKFPLRKVSPRKNVLSKYLIDLQDTDKSQNY